MKRTLLATVTCGLMLSARSQPNGPGNAVEVSFLGLNQFADYISVATTGALSGTFTFRSPNRANYPLNGTVDLQGNFSFSVQQPNGQVPLYFHGQVQQSAQDVFLKGNFCTSSTNTCNSDNGYFTAGPKF